MLANMLVARSKEIGIDLTDLQIQQFLIYLDMLQEWNQKFNLTAIKDPEGIVSKHFVDSLLLCQYINPVGKLADIGTGAGFPGLPLKICFPDLEVTLVDSLSKRVKFLEQVVSELNLSGVNCVHGRAEDLGRLAGFRDSFDYVVARAVSRLSVLAELCLPLVRVGGKFIAAKGPNLHEELESSRQAVKLLGAKILVVKETSLPIEGDLRTIAILEKTFATPEKYPRKAGIPERNPIGS